MSDQGIIASGHFVVTSKIRVVEFGWWFRWGLRRGVLIETPDGRVWLAKGDSLELHHNVDMKPLG